MTAWKEFERHVARAIGGARFWANSGEEWDVESDEALVQCKLVKRMPLEKLTQLVEQTAERAAERGKVGLVAIKLRRGGGRESEPLYVFAESVLRLWLPRLQPAATPLPLDLLTPRP